MAFPCRCRGARRRLPYDCLERRTGNEEVSPKRWPKVLKALGLVVVVGLLISRFVRRSGGGEANTPPGSLWIGETLSYIKNPHQFFETPFSRYGLVFKTRILLDEVTGDYLLYTIKRRA